MTAFLNVRMECKTHEQYNGTVLFFYYLKDKLVLTSLAISCDSVLAMADSENAMQLLSQKSSSGLCWNSV